MIRARFPLLGLAAALAACDGPLDAGGGGGDAGVDDDPLAVDDDPPPGSFDDLHRTVIAPRCSGTPGLCHHGQFEPNLATPSLAYAYLVHRPSIEKPTRYRVDVGDPATSVLIDKLRGRDVATLMPLGAEPLAEAEIARIEAWIAAGAPRRPGEAAPPRLNEPPRRPEIAVYDGATRLDTGSGAIAVGSTITLRHSVHDFETPDAQIPFAACVLSVGDGVSVVLRPAAAGDPHVAPTTYDPAGPMGITDALNWRFTWTVPATVELYDEAAGTRSARPAAGLSVTPICLYVDQATTGIAAIGFGARAIAIQ